MTKLASPNKTNFMDNNLYQYILDNTFRDDPILEQLRIETSKVHGAQMQISPDQGQFMQMLVKISNAKNILEIGTFTGYSALVMAMALPNDGRLTTCDLNPETSAIAQKYWQLAGVDHKIDLKIGPALETLEKLKNSITNNSFNTANDCNKNDNLFDLVFIDADKCNYDNYFEACFELLNTGGIILLDNMLWHGAVADPSDDRKTTAAIRALTKKLQKDPRVDLSMVPIGDGALIARKLF